MTFLELSQYYFLNPLGSQGAQCLQRALGGGRATLRLGGDPQGVQEHPGRDQAHAGGDHLQEHPQQPAGQELDEAQEGVGLDHGNAA